MKSRSYFDLVRLLSALLVLGFLSSYCASAPEPKPVVKKRSAVDPDAAKKKEEERLAREKAEREARERALRLAGEKRKLEEARLLVESLNGQLKALPVFYYPPFRHVLTARTFRRKFGTKNLAAMRAIAGKVPDIYVMEVVGHANQHPKKDAEYTTELSRKRAQQVYDHLVAAGISADKMVVKGVGNSQPINPDEPRARKNRRVTFRVSLK